MSRPAPDGRERIVLVTWADFPDDDSPEVRRLRDAGFTLRRAPRLGDRSVDAVIELARGCSAAIVSTDPFSREFFEAVPEVRVLSRVGVGSDAIDLDAASEHGVVVTVARGTNESAVADHTIGLMLAVLRKIPDADRSVRDGRWVRTGEWAGRDLHGKTVGLLGLGTIARLVVDRLAGFDVSIIGHDPYAVTPAGVRAASFEEVVETSDVLSLHLPLTPETRGLFDRRLIESMKPGAILVNTARGGIVDEAALADALDRGRLAGAGIDVFHEEPPRSSPLLALRQSTVLTPHIGGLSREAIVAMVEHATDAVIDVMSGRRPRDVVNNPVPAPWATGDVSLTPRTVRTPERKRTMNKALSGVRVAILAEDLYEDVELWYPYYRLIEEGATVTIVGSGRAEVFKGKLGIPVTADVSIDDVSAGDFDGVIVPGGFSPDYMRRKPPMIDFIREIGEAGKPVAAICHGPWALASAGLARGRKIASYFSIKDDMVGAGAEYVDADVVVDGNIITSRIPDDLPAFMPPIIEALARAKRS